MKILFLGEPQSPNTLSWVNGLRELGHEVFLASVRTDGSDENIPIGNPKLPPRLRILTGKNHLKRIIKQIKPDILIAYRITSYSYLAAKANFHPLVLAAQNDQIVFQTKPGSLKYKFLEYCSKYAIKNADLIHAWSKNIEEGLLKFDADKKKILTLHRGINMNQFKNLPKKKPFNKKSPVFISTRTLAPEYYIDKLIDVFKLVVERIPDAKLEIVGTGSEEEKLKAQTKDLNLEKNITFYGKLSSSEVYEKLNLADFYISLIQTDGLSSSLLESIASRVLPIIADIPASQEVVQNKINALCFSELNKETLFQLIFSGIDNYDEMFANLKKNQDFIIKNYDRKKNIELFINEYKKLIIG